MLDPNALNAAISVVQDLSARGVSLSAVPDTPLSLLVRDTPVLGIDAASTDYNSAVNLMVNVSRDEEHAQVLGDTVQLAAGAVRRSLDHTRNVVMPHLRLVFDAYAAKVDSLGTAPLPFAINTVYVPEVYKTNAGREFLERWENIPAMSVPPSVNLGYYNVDEIQALAQLTDDGGFNTSLSKLLTANENKGLVQISNVLKGIDTPASIDENFSLALALVLTNIEIPKEGVQMTLTAYNSQRSVLANVAAKRGLGIVFRLDNAVNANNLYYGVTKEVGVVNLVGEVYKNQLQQGLTAEVVIGNELLGRKYRGLGLLVPEALAECTAVYNRDREIRQQAHELRKRQHARQALLDVLRADQQRIVADGSFTVEGDTAEKSWQRVRDFTDRVLKTVYGDTDPQILISSIVCAVWYAHTDAWRLIDIMLDIEKTSSNLPAKEVATLATLRYISEWVASQIVASHVGPII